MSTKRPKLEGEGSSSSSSSPPKITESEGIVLDEETEVKENSGVKRKADALSILMNPSSASATSGSFRGNLSAKVRVFYLRNIMLLTLSLPSFLTAVSHFHSPPPCCCFSPGL